MKFRVEIARLVREVKVVIVEADSIENIDLKNVYEKDNGEGFFTDTEWGCEEGTHTVIGETSDNSQDANKEENNDNIDRVRSIIAQWDNGMITRGEFEGCLSDMFLKPIMDYVEKGKEFISFGSCCCSSHPPDRKFSCEITIQPHGFTITPYTAAFNEG